MSKEMEKRKWLWKRRSSEKNLGESESCSGSVSLQSEECSDNQEAEKGSSCHRNQFPDGTYKATNNIPGCKENEDGNSLVQMVFHGDEDNGLQQDGPMEIIVSEESRDETPLDATSSGTSNQDPRSVEATSFDTINGSLNQVLRSVKATSTASSNRSSNLVVLLEETTSVDVSRNLSEQDYLSVEDSLKGREGNESIKILTEKLSAALINVSLKEELVQQHSIVAEEAVAGLEKAEKEIAGLKQQLEASDQQKTALEARVSHLDEALKECVRQLRLAKEEQERKISQAIDDRSQEFDLVKLKLEDQLIRTQAQLKASQDGAKSSPLVDSEIVQKLEYLEEENIALKQELLHQSEELEVRTIERDLSTKAAETASKQHLESIKKVAKLEAECRRLKIISVPKPPANYFDQNKYVTASSFSVESVMTDSLSDKGDSFNALKNENQKNEKSDVWANALITELDQFKVKCGVARSSSSVELDLMDDFLEMERLASVLENGCHQPGHQHISKMGLNPTSNVESELGILKSQTAMLEEKVKTAEAEKGQLEIALAQMQTSLEKSQAEMIEMRMKFEQLEEELQEAITSKQDLESNASNINLEAQAMSLKIKLLSDEIDGRRVFSEELSAKCQERENELEKMKEDLVLYRLNMIPKDKLEDKELALAESQRCLEALESELVDIKMKLVHSEKEREKVNGSKQQLESELASTREESERLSAQVNSFRAEIDKEQALSAELSVRCIEFEDELLQKKHELALVQDGHTNNVQEIKQGDLETAAGKLAECQKTITCLGNQLKSLATLEDFLIDTASIPGFSGSALVIGKGSGGGETHHKLNANSVLT